MLRILSFITDYTGLGETMGADTAKVLLERSNQQRYQEFILNDDLKLSLPRPSSVPWIGATKRLDIYRKESSHEGERHVKFITKNNKPHAFGWQTTAGQLREGVRWGIIKTHSITSKVIGTLGQYRVKAYERAAKGMVSNSQAIKLKLLDLYQDRFSALEELESLVNNNNTQVAYERALLHYIAQLQDIENHLDDYFAEVDLCGLNEQAVMQIKKDIQADRERAQGYLVSVQNAESLRPYNRSRGEKSVLEFVKQQMIYGLYELQGINQDMTYNKRRYFALTRGELNDFIEDARKEIDDHQADTRNTVTAKHHGIFSANEQELITYDFSHDDLTSEREKQALLAISFIEKWDTLENKKNAKPVISNGKQKEELDIYAATRWKTHRSFLAGLKSVGYFIFNIFKGIFLATHSWEEENWRDKEFHLNAAKLRAHVKPIEPMWKKPVYFLLQVSYAFIDLFKGIRDFGSKLVIKMPEDIVNDWAATQAIPSLDEVITAATTEMSLISAEEQKRLLQILKRSGNELIAAGSKSTSKLAGVEYELTGDEQNDLLNAMTRGLTSFSGVFTHNIYAKDPIGGLIFTATYVVGIGMIYMPAYSASIFGSSLVNSFNSMSYAMASSPFGAAIAGGSTLAEVSAVAWDGVVHGPSGIAVNTLYQFGEDPLTIGAYCVAAYALGYFLANGIAGHQIPWLSELLKEDLGTDPSTGYPIIGAKFAVMLYEALATHPIAEHEQPKLVALSPDTNDALAKNKQTIERFKLIIWLSSHANMLPKLEPKQQFALARQLDLLFTKEERASLKKLIYPEKHPSIAYQLFAIPLSYIPAILRFLTSFVLSFAAWINDNPHPTAPIRMAGMHLFDKIKRDLNRIVSFVLNIVNLTYILLTPVIKMFTYIAVMAAGRIAGLFDANPGHTSHKLFASLHNFMRTLGEFFYPARMIKDVAVAHPTDTIVKTETSYVNLLQQMSKEVVEQQDKEAEHHDFSLLSGEQAGGKKQSADAKLDCRTKLS